MPKKIDWLYSRKACVTCQRANGFLEQHAVKIAETADARKDRKTPADALALAKSVNTVIVAKGKKHVVFDMKKAPPDDTTLLSHLMGPTGNLRAPTAKVGKTLFVGFNEEAYARLVD